MTKQNEKQAPQAPEVDGTTAPEVEAPSAPVSLEKATETVATIAEAIGAREKDVRRWLRAQTRATLGKAGAADVLPGKGGRYAFTPSQAREIGALYGARKATAGTQAPALAILAALAGVTVAPVEAPAGADMTPAPGEAPAL